MRENLGLIRDSAGRIIGKEELAEQIRGWLVHPRIGPVLLQRKVAATPLEIMLLHRDAVKLNKQGLAKLVLFVTKDKLVRRRIIAVQAVANRKSRREIRDSLDALIDWATYAQSRLTLN